MKVLVVDDDLGMLNLTSYQLKKLDCEPFQAGGGHDGETIALQEQPEVILLDIMMPVQDGYETCVHLREKGYAGTIILTSAINMEEGKRKALNIGASGYLQKPISVDNLKSLLDFVRLNRAE